MDIVEQLRGPVNWLRQEAGPWKDATNTYDRTPYEAADEIERLRDALRQIADPSVKITGWHGLSAVVNFQAIARNALQWQVASIKR